LAARHVIVEHHEYVLNINNPQGPINTGGGDQNVNYGAGTQNVRPTAQPAPDSGTHRLPPWILYPALVICSTICVILAVMIALGDIDPKLGLLAIGILLGLPILGVYRQGGTHRG
jgi:hypothetical protein